MVRRIAAAITILVWIAAMIFMGAMVPHDEITGIYRPVTDAHRILMACVQGMMFLSLPLLFVCFRWAKGIN